MVTTIEEIIGVQPFRTTNQSYLVESFDLEVAALFKLRSWMLGCSAGKESAVIPEVVS